MSTGQLGTGSAEMDHQYGTPERLQTRASFWAPSPPGESPQDVAIKVLREANVHKVLEIGCGRGDFASRMRDELGADVLATDRSEAMVEATRSRGLVAQVIDATELPYEDASFDAVVAMWMLYHVPDLDRTLGEVRRVLTPGGVFVSVTNGREHTADLLREVGLPLAETQFMTENGEEVLRRHFDDVARTIANGKAVADHATARAYLSTFVPEVADQLPVYDGERTFTGSSAVFVAR
ncbi:class I SAM-dependent methyltransferase [Flexivirga caeni]|uniref:Class I SAM-dependent methyltransferase n=1 Tax=Flexivirga caeni TaxID=2294115 RepID=A0A3M9ME30_9MICO|nr:class I SAM-dependent methyltransferase [Flexivirga caeni]RNI23832.1 class I SAM-dependent methyltransferase [Flexivirga caeni]